MNLVSAEYHRTTGLGNKLFPWARALVLARQINCKTLDARWFSPRGGALIRGGVNYRTALAKTWLLGNFRRDREAVKTSEFRRHYAELSTQYLDILPPLDFAPNPQTHYIFRWDKNHHFADLGPYRDFLRERLLSICSPSQHNYLAGFQNQEFIALNIRTGRDFKPKGSGEPGYYLTELDWFVQALDTARQTYGNLPAYIVSDGGKRQLGPLLEKSQVHLVRTHTAMADLRILLGAKVLLGSGNSSFSAWASFLGAMPTFSSPDTPFTHFRIGDPLP